MTSHIESKHKVKSADWAVSVHDLRMFGPKN